jgi:site-specific recombinase XerD
MANEIKMQNWLGEIPSPQTRKSYRAGIKKFEEWNQRPIEDLLEQSDEELGHVINKFYTFLKQSHPQNSCRNTTNSVLQYFKFYGKNPKYKKNIGIFATTLTTRDHILTVEECREIWKISGLTEKVIVKTWLLGLRISDACKLEWTKFNVKPSDEPVEVLIHTRKEGITAHAFIDCEFQKLLEKYLPMLDKSNRYLFQSEKGDNVKEKQMLRKLQSLQKKAGIQTNGQTFGWHIARKMVLRTSAELGITSWNAQLMVGKAVDKSISCYIDGVKLKNDAMKVHNVLKMEVANGGVVTKLEERMIALEKENAELKIVLRGMAEVFGQEILRKATEAMNKEQAKTGIAHGLPETPLTPYEALKILGYYASKRNEI